MKRLLMRAHKNITFWSAVFVLPAASVWVSGVAARFNFLEDLLSSYLLFIISLPDIALFFIFIVFPLAAFFGSLRGFFYGTIGKYVTFNKWIMGASGIIIIIEAAVILQQWF